MPSKPNTVAGYGIEGTQRVRATCLYIATRLGDLKDEMVVVGGLVPSLIIDSSKLPAEADPHVGTLDLDVGLTLAILDEERYRALTERLRDAGFHPDANEQGNLTRQRWKYERVTVDFLIPPSSDADRGGTICNIEHDFAALITPGLHLAFQDKEVITISGSLPSEGEVQRRIGVCGAGAYIVLKALAFDGRGEPKDAYDLYYVLQHYGQGLEDIVERITPLLGDKLTQRALRILARDFGDMKMNGCAKVAKFLKGDLDDVIQADVSGAIRRFLSLCRWTAS